MGGTADAAKWRFSLADHDTDGIPDLVVIRVDGVVALHVIDGAGGYNDAPLNLSTGATAASSRPLRHGRLRRRRSPRPAFDPAGRDAAGPPRRQPGWVRDVLVPARQTGTCDASGSYVPWDFDGDRYADLAIGVPFEDIGAGTDAGAVNVLYATEPKGLSAAGDQLWHQDISRHREFQRRRRRLR